ncbi:MAG: SemiSWEET family sugar transporter [Candidatus Woesearchaeota archaeon]
MVSALAWFVGMSAAVLNTSGLVPQVVKGFRTRSLKDLSWGWLGIAGSGTLLWIVYALLVSDPVLLIANGFTGVCYCLLVYQKVAF